MILVASLMAMTWAAPGVFHDEHGVKKVPKPIVPIVRYLNQLNDDGSYTFGFESADGTFRVETKDASGQIRGKYGYVEEESGLRRLVEYVSGRHVGFQASGTHLPQILDQGVAGASAEARTAEQKSQDFEYFSVDDDEDGIPDRVPAISTVKISPPQAAPAIPLVNFFPAAPAAASPPAVISAAADQLLRSAPFVALPFPFPHAGRKVLHQQQPAPVASARVNAPKNGERVFSDQYARDLQFRSVDADEDGIPDPVPVY